MSERWAVQWHSENRLDGLQRYFLWENYQPVLFLTRSEARAWIKAKLGYIAKREDLRREPHGWRVPKAIRVRVELVPL